MLSFWTIQRASGTGIVAAIASVLLWQSYAAFQDSMLLPYLAALAITAFCGASILWITATDMALHKRGTRLRAVRVFDIVLALLLVVPALAALGSLVR